MEKSGGADLLKIVAATAPIARQLQALQSGERPVAFSHVIESARAFLVAVIAGEIPETLWVICPSVRIQEQLHESLTNWLPDALFLPEAEFLAVENVLPDQEIAAERLALLSRVEASKKRHVIVATRASLEQSAPKPGALRAATLRLRRGAAQGLERVAESLGEAGYERVAQVTTRGQFAIRGGILDVYSWQAELPIRAEFFGDEIESLREFDLDTQTSLRNLNDVELLLGAADDQSGKVRDYIGPGHLRIVIEDGDEEADVRITEGWVESQDAVEDFSGAFVDCEIGEFDTGEFIIAEAKRQQFFARLTSWRESGARIAIYFQTEGEIERFREIMAEANASLGGIDLLEGTLARGFCFPAANLVVLAAAELFGRAPTHGRRRLQRTAKFGTQRVQIDFSDLHEGELVVHLEHGIGRFQGLQKMGGPESSEVLAIEFAEEAKLFVPLEQAFLVSRYVGVGKKSPALSSLADARWSRAKKNAAASIFDYAGKMLALQAERETQRGHAFGADTKWQVEFEHSFPFRETPDQLKAIADTKRDMEEPRSMDRLICGDVGFGKTEVAIRAAFKAVMEGKQVAVLTPTTVLAQQHFETFRQRMLDYPVRIEMLSRFRSHAEQRKVLEQLRDGGVDIVIGTHRLISGDVVFKDLGLVVIDEEQRFGVLHKEKIQGTLQAGRRPHAFRDADPAHALLVVSRGQRHVDDRDAAAESAAGRDGDLRLRRAHHSRRDQSRARAPGPGLFSAQPGHVDSKGARSDRGTLPRGAGRVWSRPDGRGRTRSGHAAFRRGKNRRAGLHDDHRERPRYSECEHDHHRSGRSLRAGRSLSAARPGRARRAQGLRLPASPARDDDGGRGAQADQRHPAIQLVRRGLSDCDARPGDSRRRQHPRHGAERSHRRGRVRSLLPAS